VGIVRGVAVKPHEGTDRCHAVEIAFEATEDYSLALLARVVLDNCGQAPFTTVERSGVCAWHYSQIQERRRAIET
jgi:hypothetical protein